MPAVAEEDVAILRRGYEAFASGDLETILAILDPDIEVEDHDHTLDQRSYRGHQGFFDLVATVNDGFEDVRYTPNDFTAAQAAVLVDVTRTGRGAASGVPVHERQFHVWRLSAGRAVSFHTFVSEPEAREAAGLQD